MRLSSYVVLVAASCSNALWLYLAAPRISVVQQRGQQPSVNRAAPRAQSDEAFARREQEREDAEFARQLQQQAKPTLLPTGSNSVGEDKGRRGARVSAGS